MKILIEFMELRPDLAKGFVKGVKVDNDQLWLQLARELNASGPPTKDVNVWRKVWTDWKLSVKHRLGHNRVEAGKTGGVRFNKYILSPIDEQVAIVSGLYIAVDGVANTKSYEAVGKENVHKKRQLPTTSTATVPPVSPLPPAKQNVQKKRKLAATARATVSYTPFPSTVSPLPPMTADSEASGVSAAACCLQEEQTQEPLDISPCSTPTTSPQLLTRKRHVPDIGDVLLMESEHLSKLCEKVHEVRSEIRESRKYVKELSRSTRDLNRNVRELKILKDKELKEMLRHNHALEKSNQTKNELKLQFLELEQMKFGLRGPTTD